MALKKSQLYSSLWQSCDELRGGMDASQYKDYAFLLHLIASLKNNGKGAIILPHGVLFRGNKEADIRKNLILRGFIKGIIGLPANLFYGTGIPACILIVDKEHAHARAGIFMIDASKGFLKDGNKNRLRTQDIHKIVDVFNKQIELPRYSRMVPVSEIADPANDYNLNIPRYIDSSEPEDLHDLDAHLNGGIPDRDIDALEEYWNIFPSLRQALFTGNGRPGYSDARIEARQESAARELEEFIEEHTGEEGLLAEAVNDKGKVTKTAVAARLKAVRGESESDEEREVLMRCEALINAESKAGKAVKDSQTALNERVLARYASLTETEIKSLVVEDKWFADIRTAIGSEVERLNQRLAGRVKELEERYVRTLPELEKEVDAFGAKVEGHLRRMGVSL